MALFSVSVTNLTLIAPWVHSGHSASKRSQMTGITVQLPWTSARFARVGAGRDPATGLHRLVPRRFLPRPFNLAPNFMTSLIWSSVSPSRSAVGASRRLWDQDWPFSFLALGNYSDYGDFGFKWRFNGVVRYPLVNRFWRTIRFLLQGHFTCNIYILWPNHYGFHKTLYDHIGTDGFMPAREQ